MSNLLPIQKQLRALASAETAANLQRFFKTGPGQYGEGDLISFDPLAGCSGRWGSATC